ncbi:MAG: hypothetical protein CMI31_09935 [Opitutae bacterium]|nr:hypothetical protein [Opitutae bacterium]|tara:strand:+ start:284 stop:1393 length:1110 start_codon:yes stop_codon:yes gene_type:complete
MKYFHKEKRGFAPISESIVRISSVEELVLFENSTEMEDTQYLEIAGNLLELKEFHFLFFIGKSLVVPLGDSMNIREMFLNPMISHLLVEDDFDCSLCENLPTSAVNQREIQNIVCHLDVTKIQEYTQKSLKDILLSVWNQFMVYHFFNVPEIDYVQEYEELAEEVGTIRLCHPVNNKSTKFSKSRDIKPNPDLYHYFSSTTRQPLHTDYAYYREDECPDWLMLYCVYPSEVGGKTSILSTKTLDRILTKYNPDLLEKIHTHVTWKYTGKDGDKIHEKFIYDGKFINWNYWQIKEELNDESTMEIREEFFRFLEDVIVSGGMYDILKEWNPRDCLIFNDHLNLHGRNAFLGDRWLKDHAFYGEKEILSAG